MPFFRTTPTRLLALSLTLAAASTAFARQSPATITPQGNTTPHNWTTEQILTCTVSDCWQLAGKDEATFFDIVQQLATISAQTRGVTLPDNAAAGKRAGDYIKMKAKADHGALLYAIVDASVRHVAAKSAATAAAAQQ